MKKKIIYYYQTFCGLKDILSDNPNVTHIHLSAFHFGTDENNHPYLHLNDFCPNNSKFNNVWSDIKKSHNLGIKIHSVANRLVTFPNYIKHTSVSCSDQTYRMVLNLNYVISDP